MRLVGPGVTDIYRSIMTSAGRETVGMYERINRARGGRARPAAAETQDEWQPEEQEPAASDSAGAGTEASSAAAAEFSVGETIEAEDKAATGWYAAKVLKLSDAGVKIHYVGWKARFDEVRDLTTACCRDFSRWAALSHRWFPLRCR